MGEEKLLVRKAKKGDVEAFGRLYEEVYKDLYHFALYLLNHAQDAEDIVAETVLDAYRSIANLKKEESFRAWIFKILSNKCRMKRKEYLNKEMELDPEMEGESKNFEETGDLQIAMSCLDEEERLIINLIVIAGYKSGEVASMLHMNANTVRSKLSRAYEKLRKWLI